MKDELDMERRKDRGGRRVRSRSKERGARRSRSRSRGERKERVGRGGRQKWKVLSY